MKSIGLSTSGKGALKMELNDIVKKYFKQNTELNKRQKEVLQLGSEIKNALSKENLSEYEVDDIVVTLTTINRDILDEDGLIAEIREQFPSVVKTKEYIDMDALENLVYTRQISPDVMAKFIIKKEPTIRLNIKKRKGKENGKDNND
ncbi:MAG: hypothetical protein J5725_07525 [Bacteroidales bacterium]|nr:hypothetical protein [Bacteroidales bacterium]